MEDGLASFDKGRKGLALRELDTLLIDRKVH